MSTPSIPCEWNIATREHAEEKSLAEALSVPRVIARLLLARGIRTTDEAQRFLNPRVDQLADPYALTDMDKAVERLQHARMAGEHVRVFGDYDVDGISGTALLSRCFRRYVMAHVSYALPSRMIAGYGINANSVEQAKADGVDLIVTVDNGVSALDAAEAAKKLGVDLIITDHHTIDTDIPDATAVINPKRDDPEGPFAQISGSAVGLKLACALEDSLLDLDLVALGTVADIVPLVDENRVLVAAGVQAVRQAPRAGIEALAKQARVAIETFKSENIAFHLGPRINAAGRLGDGTVGVRLLLTDDPEEAAMMAEELDEANAERRQIEQAIYEAALTSLDTTFNPSDAAIVLDGKGWHPGVIGIVASRIQSIYCRPVVLIAVDEEGVGRSSSRSVPSFNLVEGLSTCKDLLVKFGGHHMAAGMTIVEENIAAFRERFLSVANELQAGRPFTKELAIDAPVSLSDIDGALLNALDAMEPFGSANPAPLFCTYGVEVLPNSVRELRGGHLKFTVRQSDRAFPVIAFGWADRVDLGDGGMQVDIAFSPQFNTWRGETSIQLQLRDIKRCP